MSDHEDVAIFWDYENCSPSCNMTGYDIVNNIREIAHSYGSVKLFKAYLELSEQSPKSTTLRSELQSCGVSLTDCPHNGRKDVADKMMIVDMLTYALDTPAPATIVLISGDRDFVYAVSVLRLRRYRVVLVAPQQAHNSLRSQATAVLDWSTDVLGKEKPSGLVTPGESVRFAHKRSQSSVNSTSIPPGSPLAPRSQRRLSFRDIPPQRPAIEPLQGTANIRSPRAPTTPLQAAWTPAGDHAPDAAGSSSRLLRPQGSSQQGLPTPASEPGSATFQPKTTPDESVLNDSEDIADLNLHLKNLASRSSSNSSPSPYISVTPVEDRKVPGQEQTQPTSTSTRSSSPAIPGVQPDQAAEIIQRRPSLSPIEVKDLFRGNKVSPAAVQTHNESDMGSSSMAIAVPVAEHLHTGNGAVRPASAPASMDPASCINEAEDILSQTAHVSGSTTSLLSVIGASGPPPSVVLPLHTPDSPAVTRVEVIHDMLTTLSGRSSPSSLPPSPTTNDNATVAVAMSLLPPHFANLVRAMQELHAKSTKPELLRSSVAVLLSQRHKGEYKGAGFPDFKAFSTAAQQYGLVTMGGSQGYAWMKLEPEWLSGCEPLIFS